MATSNQHSRESCTGKEFFLDLLLPYTLIDTLLHCPYPLLTCWRLLAADIFSRPPPSRFLPLCSPIFHFPVYSLSVSPSPPPVLVVWLVKTCTSAFTQG